MWFQVPPLEELPLEEQALVAPLSTIDMLQATPGAETLSIPASELAPGVDSATITVIPGEPGASELGL